MAEVLKSGHLRHLRVLDLMYKKVARYGEDPGAAIARALQERACPDFVKLKLFGCRLSDEDRLALEEAMRSGTYVKLEDLRLGDDWMDDGNFIAILQALQAGSCTSLKRFEVQDCGLPFQSAIAL